MKKFLRAALLMSSILLLGACKGNTASEKHDNQATATIKSTPKKEAEDKADDTETSKKADKGNASGKNTEKDENKKTGDSSLLRNHKLFGQLANEVGAENAKVVEQKDYQVNWADKSWAGLNLSIDSVSVLKVSDYKNYEGKEANGFVILHFVADNTQRDLSINPDQAMINTNTGEQAGKSVYGLDNAFSGELMKGTKADSYFAYPLKKLEKAADIHKLRLKFDGSFTDYDFESDDSLHDYDVTLELKDPEVI